MDMVEVSVVHRQSFPGNLTTYLHGEASPMGHYTSVLGCCRGAQHH